MLTFADPPEQPRWVWRRLNSARLRSGLGLAIQVAGGLGTALCLVVLVLVPLLAGSVASVGSELLIAVADGARGLTEPVELAGNSLGEASTTLDATGAMLFNSGESLGSLSAVLDSVGEVLGEDAPATIDAARGALVSAEAGAEAIDGTLRALSYASFLTGVDYDPEQPLQESLVQVSDSLEPLPGDLRQIGYDLDTVEDDLAPVQSSIEDVAGNLGDLVGSLEELQAFLLEQSSALGNLARSAEGAAERVPAYVWTVTALAELLLLLTCVEQVAVFFVGGQLRSCGGHTAG